MRPRKPYAILLEHLAKREPEKSPRELWGEVSEKYPEVSLQQVRNTLAHMNLQRPERTKTREVMKLIESGERDKKAIIEKTGIGEAYVRSIYRGYFATIKFPVAMSTARRLTCEAKRKGVTKERLVWELVEKAYGTEKRRKEKGEL